MTPVGAVAIAGVGGAPAASVSEGHERQAELPIGAVADVVTLRACHPPVETPGVPFVASGPRGLAPQKTGPVARRPLPPEGPEGEVGAAVAHGVGPLPFACVVAAATKPRGGHRETMRVQGRVGRVANGQGQLAGSRVLRIAATVVVAGRVFERARRAGAGV